MSFKRGAKDYTRGEDKFKEKIMNNPLRNLRKILCVGIKSEGLQSGVTVSLVAKSVLFHNRGFYLTEKELTLRNL
ncbi:hypothetical protein [Chitinophaga sp. MM2321]|uniref:hypothetical protein n=1 Tax=Chitinophaga sp. MM2321 TaxID=3137178 RepID=UPI0032D56D26